MSSKIVMSHHLVVSIKGLEERLLGKVPKKFGSWEILESNGRMLTKPEVWAEITRAKDKGFDVIPMCENIDKKGHCLGHKKYVSLRGVTTETRTYRDISKEERAAIIKDFLSLGSAATREKWNLSSATLHHVRWHNKEVEAAIEEENLQRMTSI